MDISHNLNRVTLSLMFEFLNILHCFSKYTNYNMSQIVIQHRKVNEKLQHGIALK